MIIAITGAGGFLGRELLKQLSVCQDISVFAFSSKCAQCTQQYANNDRIIAKSREDALTFDYSDVDVLLNCAFPMNSTADAFASGMHYNQQVLTKAAHDGVKAVVNISSQSVYGRKRKEPADENTLVCPEDNYAVGKYSSELLVNALFEDVPHTNIRMASMIGAGFDMRITNRFAKKVIAGEEITIVGGKQMFGFLDFRDAASGLIKMMTSDHSKWLEVYDLGIKDGYSLLKIVDCINEVGSELGLPVRDPLIKQDDAWQNSVLICERFYKDFDWMPSLTLKDSVRDIFKAELARGE